MNFLQYKDAADLLSKTGWSVEIALGVVQAELERLKQESRS